MNDFTQTEINIYINKGIYCPKCGEPSVHPNGYDSYSDTEVYREMRCSDCGVEFTEIYEMTHIEKIDAIDDKG